jgi:type IV secretory pathway VirB3-like protein
MIMVVMIVMMVILMMMVMAMMIIVIMEMMMVLHKVDMQRKQANHHTASFWGLRSACATIV